MKTKLINLDRTADEAITDILSRQKKGYWSGDIYYHTYLTASIAIIYKIIGIEDGGWEEKAVKIIERTQRPDGSWGLVDEEIFDHPTINEAHAEESLEIKTGIARNTTACLLALKKLGGSMESIERAEEYVRRNVDMKHVDEITRIFLTYYGDADINTIKIPPVEAVLIPKFLKFSIERQAPVWCVNSIISALLLKAQISGEYSWSPLRKFAINKARKLLIKNQLPNGSWYNVTDPTMHSILALYQCGYRKDHEIMQKGIDFLNGQKNETGYVHRYWLPVWDTALTLIALSYVDMPGCHPLIDKSISYLLNSRSENGSWGFCPDGRNNSDCDDTAMAMVALRNFGIEKEVLESGINWLFEMQNSDGGWAAHTKNHSSKEQFKPTLEDPTLLLKDPSTADLTGHVLHVMGKMGFTIDNPKIQKAIKFLKKDQLDCGAWYGRWGICYTYGTSRVLWGLMSIGEDMESEYVERAKNWLVNHQNADGGWGEHYMSYFRQDLAGIGKSTPAQTGWTLVGLLSLPDLPSDCIKKGVKFLTDLQSRSDKWPNTYSVGAIEIYKNTNYDIWPLMALGLFKRRYQKIKEERINEHL